MHNSSAILQKFCPLLFILLSACNQKTEGTQTKSLDSINQLIVVDTSKLKGRWWSQENQIPHAAFAIEDTVFFYPDLEEQSEFKYHIRQDTLIIYYEGYADTSIIRKVTDDSLVLYSKSMLEIYVKSGQEYL